jgi:excinuclease ABC subunit C
VDENQPLPQLIIIDGKRTIVSGTKSIDDLGLRGKIAIIGIVDWKNYFIRRFHSFVPREKIRDFKIIQQLRNEASIWDHAS